MRRLRANANLLLIKLVLSILHSKLKLASIRVISILLTGFNTIFQRLLLKDSQVKHFMIF